MTELYRMRIKCKETDFYWTYQAAVCVLSAGQVVTETILMKILIFYMFNKECTCW